MFSVADPEPAFLEILTVFFLSIVLVFEINISLFYDLRNKCKKLIEYLYCFMSCIKDLKKNRLRIAKNSIQTALIRY